MRTPREDGFLKGINYEKLIQIEFGVNGLSLDYILLGKEQGYLALAVVETKRSKEALSDTYQIEVSGYATEVVTKVRSPNK